MLTKMPLFKVSKILTYAILGTMLSLATLAQAESTDIQETASPQLLERERVVVHHPPLSDKALKLLDPRRHSISYPTERGFLNKAEIAQSSTERPEFLDPMGPARKNRHRPLLPLAKIEPPAPIEQPEIKVEPVTPPTPSITPQQVSNAFLDWVKSTTEASRLAKEQFEKTQQPAPSGLTPTGDSGEVFLNLRFPYTGAQPAPNKGSSATYSTPKP